MLLLPALAKVKIRGHRVEPAEVAAVLAGCDGIDQAVVIARQDRPGDTRLVGYVTGTADPVGVRAQLAGVLPAYMVPAAIVVMARLPLTINGKLDTKALPAPEYTGTQSYRAPTTPTEEILAAIYAQVLGIQRVSIDDSFFDLGGDSLLAMRAIAAINTSLDTNLNVRALFDAPTVTSLVSLLDAPSRALEFAPVRVLQNGSGSPLFCIHHGGGVSWSYRALGPYLDCPIVGIQQDAQSAGSESGSVRSLAKDYAQRLVEFYPGGPYNILGWSFGGNVAHELAIELSRRGYVVRRLIILDAAASHDDAINIYGAEPIDDDALVLDHSLEDAWGPDGINAEVPHARPFGELRDLIVKNTKANIRYRSEHTIDVFDGDLTIFSATRSAPSGAIRQSWRPYVTGDVTDYPVDCTHHEMLTVQAVELFGKQLRAVLES
uniref:thioesterase domain-containing protein n=1 Tax=Mycobacterium simulans TaxID=627089 RepID=UPI0021B3E532|nr:thioesterase domain-containing protein [Mycobacterium simulans]